MIATTRGHIPAQIALSSFLAGSFIDEHGETTKETLTPLDVTGIFRQLCLKEPALAQTAAGHIEEHKTAFPMHLQIMAGGFMADMMQQQNKAATPDITVDEVTLRINSAGYNGHVVLTINRWDNPAIQQLIELRHVIILDENIFGNVLKAMSSGRHADWEQVPHKTEAVLRIIPSDVTAKAGLLMAMASNVEVVSCEPAKVNKGIVKKIIENNPWSFYDPDIFMETFACMPQSRLAKGIADKLSPVATMGYVVEMIGHKNIATTFLSKYMPFLKNHLCRELKPDEEFARIHKDTTPSRPIVDVAAYSYAGA